MCTSCGGKAARLRVPGGSPQNPLVIGEPNGETARPVTLLTDIGKQKSGTMAYVSGDGVEQAIEDGKIANGYQPPRARQVQQQPSDVRPFYVKLSPGKYAGFKTLPAAERYARSTGGTVLTREQLLAEGGQ